MKIFVLFLFLLFSFSAFSEVYFCVENKLSGYQGPDHSKLDQYKPGDPKMKPDVLKQIKELEQERIKMFEEKKKEMMKNMGNNPDKIVLQQEGKDPITLTMQDAVEIMNKQNKEILNLRTRVNELELKLQQVARQGALKKNEEKEEIKEEKIEIEETGVIQDH